MRSFFYSFFSVSSSAPPTKCSPVRWRQKPSLIPWKFFSICWSQPIQQNSHRGWKVWKYRWIKSPHEVCTLHVYFTLFGQKRVKSWWRRQMGAFSALLALCVTGEFPSQKPVTRSFDVFFDLRLNKRLSKQSWGWWYQTPSRSLWRHCND